MHLIPRKKGKRLAKNSHSQVDGNSINRAKPSLNLKETSASPRKAANVRGPLLDSTSDLMCPLLFQYEIRY